MLDSKEMHFSTAPQFVSAKEGREGKRDLVVTEELRFQVARFGDVCGYMYQKGKNGGTWLLPECARGSSWARHQGGGTRRGPDLRYAGRAVT